MHFNPYSCVNKNATPKLDKAPLKVQNASCDQSSNSAIRFIIPRSPLQAWNGWRAGAELVLLSVLPLGSLWKLRLVN